MAVIRDDGDCFSVALGNDAGFWIVSGCVEGDSIANSEALHLLLHAHFLKVAQAFNNFAVELSELDLAEFRDVNWHGTKISNCRGVLPAMRQQFFNAAVHMARQSGQHVLEINPWIMAMQFGGLQQTHHDGGSLTGEFTSREEPGLPAHCPRSNQIFDMVVINLYSAVIQIDG